MLRLNDRSQSLAIQSIGMPVNTSSAPKTQINATQIDKTPVNWLLIAFVSPALILVLLISIYPVIDAAILSVFRTRYAVKEEFVWFANYSALFNDPSVWKAGVNSLIFTLGSLCLALPLALGIALLLNSEVPFRSSIRTIVILPWIVSQTVVAMLWAWLINADFGPLTFLAENFLGQRFALLASPSQAMGTLIVINVWASYPQAALLLLAALQTIPKDLYESAKIDGASAIGSFWYVTLPLLKPTILVILIQLTLLYFNLVTLIFVFTGGGPLQGTETLALRVLKISFENWNLGQGAALGLLITLINLVCSLLYIRVLRGRPHER